MSTGLILILFAVFAVIAIIVKVLGSIKIDDADYEKVMTDYERMTYYNKDKGEVRKENTDIREKELSDIDNMDGVAFERYIGNLLEHKGFSVEYTPVTDDKGVDIIATRDGIRYAIQIKRYSSAISRRAVSDAVAGKSYCDCDIPMVITNNYFTKGAEELAKATRCKLIDRYKLTNWITDFDTASKFV